jgi:L-iditol 2-dehydrogenase
MKAAFFIEPQKIELRDVPDPPTPDDGLKIAVKACAVCGSDIRRWREGPLPGSDDIIPGHEIAGEVIEVGKKVSGYAVGDRLAVGPDVHCDECWYCQRGMYNLCDHIRFYGITPGHHGGFAEQMIVPNEILTRGICHKMPEGLSFAAASISEPCTSVIATHEKINTQLGDTVVIIGAGPTGCIGIAVAKSRGARVIVAQRSEERRHFAAAFGPDLIINPAEEDLISAVKKYTNGRGADSVICANPNASTHSDGVKMVRKGGKVVLYGGLPKANPLTTLDGNLIHYGEIEVIGPFSYHPTHHALALDLLERDIIPAGKVITHEMSLDNVQAAYELAADRKALKVIVKP